MSKKKTYSVRLTEKTVNAIKHLGNGSLSHGIQKLISCPSFKQLVIDATASRIAELTAELDDLNTM